MTAFSAKPVAQKITTQGAGHGNKVKVDKGEVTRTGQHADQRQYKGAGNQEADQRQGLGHHKQHQRGNGQRLVCGNKAGNAGGNFR